MTMVSFYTPWKHLTTSGFLMYSGGTERDQLNHLTNMAQLYYVSMFDTCLYINNWLVRARCYYEIITKNSLHFWNFENVSFFFFSKMDIFVNDFTSFRPTFRIIIGEVFTNFRLVCREFLRVKWWFNLSLCNPH